MRFKPRPIFMKIDTAEVDEDGDPVEGYLSGIAGLTTEQISVMIHLAMQHRAMDEFSFPDLDSDYSTKQMDYAAEQMSLYAKVKGWLDRGPEPNTQGARREGLFRSSGDEVMLLIEGYDAWGNITTAASLRLYTIANAARDLEGGHVYNDTLLLPPKYAAARRLITRLETIKESERGDELRSYWHKPLWKSTGSDIKRRREALFEARYRRSRQQTFSGGGSVRQAIASMLAPAPPPPPSPPQKAYSPDPRRPKGRAYDLPSPKVKIGTKLRASFGRTGDFLYWRGVFVKNYLKGVRTRQPQGRIPDYAKRDIREKLDFIERAYEVEVVGVRASGWNGMLMNQCYVGGTPGASGIHFMYSVMFRGEQPATDGRPANQVFFLFPEEVQEHTVLGYVMPMPNEN
jgi:hypothetical protein